MVKINMHQNGNLVSMLVHILHFILNFKIVIFCKINHRNHILVGKDLMHWLKCLSSHLATKLCLIECCNFGCKYSMNSYDVVLLYTKVNFLSGWPFLAIVVSRAKRCHWITSKCNPITYFRHKDNLCTPQLG